LAAGRGLRRAGAHFHRAGGHGELDQPAIFRLDRLGGGGKLVRNVADGVGVVEGECGLQRGGLPRRSAHDGERFIHEPPRLPVCVAAPREATGDVRALPLRRACMRRRDKAGPRTLARDIRPLSKPRRPSPSARRSPRRAIPATLFSAGGDSTAMAAALA
jgi:hypothetical protein